MTGRPQLALVVLLTGAVLTACSPTSTPAAPRSEAAPVAAPVFHLDCSAPANGDGSPERPWNTPTAVSGHGPFAAGSSVLLRRGTRCTGQVAPTGSGTPDRPVVLGAYGTGARPVVDGGGTPDQTGAVELRNVHDWIVQDLAVTNAAPAVDRTFRAGILVRNDVGGTLPNITVRRNLVYGVTSSPGSWSADPHAWGGIAVVATRSQDGGARTFSNLRISGNTVDGVGRSGITVWSEDYARGFSTDVLVDHNSVHRAQGDSILLLGVDGGVVERNRSTEGGFLPPCPGCAFTEYNTANAGIWPTRSRNVLIRSNEVSGENDSGGDGQGIDVDEDTEGVVVEFNHSHDNRGGGILLCGAAQTEVRFNVFRGNGGGEITFSCPTQGAGIRIHHNVIDSRAGTGAAIVRTTQGRGTAPVMFADNVVANGSGGGYTWPAAVESGGNFFSGNHPVTEPRGPADLQGDWPFVSPPVAVAGLESLAGYALRRDSSAATPGVPVSDAGSYDLLGGLVPAGASGRGVALSPDTGTRSAAPAAPTGVTAQASPAGTVVSWSAAPGMTHRLVRRVPGEREVVVAEGLLRGAFTDPRTAPSAGAIYGLQAVSPTGVRSPFIRVRTH